MWSELSGDCSTVDILVLFLDFFLWFSFWIKANLNTCTSTSCDLAVRFTLTFANLSTSPFKHLPSLLGSYSINLSHKAVPLSLKGMPASHSKNPSREIKKRIWQFLARGLESVQLRTPVLLQKWEGRFTWTGLWGAEQKRGVEESLTPGWLLLQLLRHGSVWAADNQACSHSQHWLRQRKKCFKNQSCLPPTFAVSKFQETD